MLVVFGAAGILGMAWFFPLLAALASRIRRRRRKALVKSGELVIATVIPVHNEAKALESTVDSVKRAAAAARSAGASFALRIVVGADGCSDDSADRARSLKAEVVESRECRGKWRTLQSLTEAAKPADWYILADAGAIWPRSLLLELLPQMRKSNVVAAAPAYRNPSGGFLESLHWRFEAHLKGLENLAGGPVSVHGATVAYRAVALRRVLRELRGRDWCNDDVVIPMLIRALFRGQRLVYLPGKAVTELVREGKRASETQRRRRMASGNAEWVLLLLRGLWRRSPVAALLALRRVFRLLWAYWFLALVVGTLSYLVETGSGRATLAAFGTAAITAAFTRPRAGRGLAAAALASIAAPIYLMLMDWKVVRWN